MSQAASKVRRATLEPEPAWEVAYLFPPQGQWEEGDYLALDTNRLVELSGGFLEVPAMPTMDHPGLSAFFYRVLFAFVTSLGLGSVYYAPLRVRLWRGKFREPDVMFMHRDHADRMGNEYWNGADLVMEVVSEGEEDRRRDLVDKPREYARAGIPEYWIIDPREETITVLRLSGKRYVVHGEFAKGAKATSHSLPGFSVDVTEAFAQQRSVPAAGKGRRKAKRPRP